MTNKSYEVEVRGNTKVYRAEFGKAMRSNGAFAKSMRGAAQSVAVIDGPLGGVSSRVSVLSSIISSGTPVIFGFGAALAALTASAFASTKAFEQYQRNQLKTEALIRATGGAAGLTAQQLQDQADQVALNTLASVGGIAEAQHTLQTFKRVQGATFTEAIKLSQDMAATGFGALKTNAIGLGKALQDPLTGLTLLNKQGSLTKAQQKAIGDEFRRTGDLAAAQVSILEAIREQVGGAGTAEAGGVAGAADTLAQRWDELLRSLGETSGSASIATDSLHAIAGGLAAIRERIDPGIDTLEKQLAAVTTALEAVRAKAQENENSFFGGFSAGMSREAISQLEAEEAAIRAKLKTFQDAAAAETLAQKEAQAAADESKREADKVREEERVKKERERLQKIQAQNNRIVALQQQRYQRVHDAALQADGKLIELENLRHQREVENLEAELAKLQEKNLLTEELKAQHDEALENAEAVHQAKLKVIRDEASKEELEKEREKRQQLSEGYSTLLDIAGEYFEGMGSKEAGYTRVAIALGKTLLDEKKRDAIVSIGTNTYDAAMGAYNALAAIPIVGPVLGAAAAGAVILAGGAYTAKVMGMAHSGMTNIPREGSYLLDGGERVVQPEQNKDLTRFLNNAGGGAAVVNIHNYGNQQVETSQNGDQLEIVIGRMRDALRDDISRGTGVAPTLQQTYGLTRKGTV